MKHTRLYPTLFLLTILALLALYFAHSEVRNRALNRLRDQQFSLARQAARGIEGFFDHYAGMMGAIIQLDSVADLDDNGERVIDVFFRSHSNEIATLSRFGADGRILYASPANPRLDRLDLSKKDFFNQAMETRMPVVSDVFANRLGLQAVVLCVPIFKNGVFAGSLNALIPFNTFTGKFMEGTKPSGQGYAWMMDRNGVEIYCDTPAHVGRSIFENFRGLPAVLDLAGEMLKGMEGQRSYVIDKSGGQGAGPVKKLAVYVPVHIPGNLWSIAVSMPEDEAFGAVNGFWSKWLPACGIGLVLIALFLYRSLILSREESKRREIEAALQDSEKKYRRLVELAQEGIWVIDTDGDTKFVNPRMSEMLGYSTQDMLGRSLYSFLEQRSVDICRSMLELCKQGVIEEYDFEFLRSDGVPINAHMAVCPMLEDETYAGALAVVADITKRKRAEEALKESQQRLADIIDFLPDATFVIDTEGKVIAWNRAMEEMTGTGAQAMLGKSNYEYSLLFYGKREPILVDMVLENRGDEEKYFHLERKGPVLQGQAFLPLLKGRPTYLFGAACALYDSRGNVAGAIESIRDITFPKQAEEALKESQRQFADIIDFLPDATFVIDRAGKVIAWNRAMEEMTGTGAQSMLGKGDYEYALPIYGERRPILIDLVFEPNAKYESQYSSIRKKRGVLAAQALIPSEKGGTTYLFGTASALYDSRGNVVGAIESIRDITDQKLMEEAVARAEEKYRDMVENSVVGIFQITMDGRLVIVNASIAEMLGYDSPGELLSAVDNIQSIYHKPERRLELLRLIREKGSVKEFEVEFVRKDKSVIWSALNIRAVCDPTGEIAYMEGTASDITDRKILRAQLDQAQKMEAIGTLAGGIAHDFNNILMPIIGYTELSINTVRDDRVAHNLKQVLLSANRAKDLVRQILTFSRKTEHERKPVQVSLILKEALKLLRSSLPSTIDIRQSITPEAAEGATLADPTQIHQVLVNLCTNAAHAMRAKGGALTITLENVEFRRHPKGNPTEIEPGSYLKLSVSDTGHGMDDSVKQRIFDPYFTTKGPNEGTGLGLAVVYGIVKNLSGAIKVSSEPGKGATFDVYFPRIKKAARSPADEHENLPTGSGLVLVVDDEKFIVDMLKEMLQALGYSTVPRYSSSDALEAFRAKPESFDLVITDMTMPHMTGIDLARELLAIRPNVPVILCTGFSETLDDDKAKPLGFKELLMKPVSMRDLALAVDKIMTKARKQKDPD